MDLSRLQSKFAPDPGAAQLRQLSDEVGRIATRLAQLAVQPENTANAPAEEPANDRARFEVAGETVRSIIQARRLRYDFFPDELFADPAWDMLLDLFEAELAQHRVSTSSLSAASAVPATTALRWITTMTKAGLFRRRPDPHDGRRVFIELSPEASEAMRRYFNKLGKAQPV